MVPITQRPITGSLEKVVKKEKLEKCYITVREMKY